MLADVELGIPAPLELVLVAVRADGQHRSTVRTKSTSLKPAIELHGVDADKVLWGRAYHRGVERGGHQGRSTGSRGMWPLRLRAGKKEERRSEPTGQDAVAALADAYMGPMRGWQEKTRSGAVICVDARQSPPAPQRLQILHDAAELAMSGTASAAELLVLGLQDDDAGLRRAARSLWERCALSGSLPPEVPDIEVRSDVYFPARGVSARYDARHFERVDTEDEGAAQLARTLLPAQCTDWTALLVRRPDVDVEADWRSGAPVIAFGVGPWAEPEASSIETLGRTVGDAYESPASGAEALQSAECHVRGHPAWLVERSLPGETAAVGRLRRKQYLIAVRETLLGLTAQSSEPDWAAHEPDFEVLIRWLRLPKPKSECGEDDRFGRLSPSAWMLGRMFGGDAGERSQCALPATAAASVCQPHPVV